MYMFYLSNEIKVKILILCFRYDIIKNLSDMLINVLPCNIQTGLVFML